MNVENKLLFNEYLEEEIKLGGHTYQGMKNLKSRVPKLFVFLEEMGYPAVGLGVRQAQEYQGWLIKIKNRDGEQYQASSIKSLVYVASHFYEFMKRKKLVPSNPFKVIKHLRQGFKLPKDLPKEKEMALYLEKLSTFEEEESLRKQARRYQIHVIAELLYSSGIRVNEATHLKTEDINFEKGTITVKAGKGNITRTAWLNDYAKDVLKFYLEHMRPLILDRNCVKSSRIFGANWETLPKTINKYLKANSKSLGLPNITAHSFRHALGYHLHRAGCNIRYIQDILGHKKLKATEIYTKVDKENLKEIIDTYHPRDFKGKGHEQATN